MQSESLSQSEALLGKETLLGKVGGRRREERRKEGGGKEERRQSEGQWISYHSFAISTKLSSSICKENVQEMDESACE